SFSLAVRPGNKILTTARCCRPILPLLLRPLLYQPEAGRPKSGGEQMTNIAKYLSAAALGMLALSHPAMAAETGQPVAVQYSDLNLASEAGRQELDRRIEAAVRKTCGMGETVTGSRIPSREARKCYHETRSQIDQRFAAIVTKSQAGG